MTDTLTTPTRYAGITDYNANFAEIIRGNIRRANAGMPIADIRTPAGPTSRAMLAAGEIVVVDQYVRFVDTITSGSRVTGRDVTSGRDATGTVVAIHYPAGLGYYTDTPNDRPERSRRYTLSTGTTYPTGGEYRPIVECATLTTA